MAFEETREQQQMYNYFRSCIYIFLMAHYGITGAILASAVIFLYDGTRGFIRGNGAKYVFYAVYPVHLLLIAACI